MLVYLGDGAASLIVLVATQITPKSFSPDPNFTPSPDYGLFKSPKQ